MKNKIKTHFPAQIHGPFLGVFSRKKRKASFHSEPFQKRSKIAFQAFHCIMTQRSPFKFAIYLHDQAS